MHLDVLCVLIDSSLASSSVDRVPFVHSSTSCFVKTNVSPASLSLKPSVGFALPLVPL